MRDYLVVECSAGGDHSRWRAAEALILGSGVWRKTAERRSFSVFVETQKPPSYRHLPSVTGALIGDVFDAAAARDGRGEDLDLLGLGSEPTELACQLVKRGFGRYVVILNDDRGPLRVLRDPMGVMEAIGWRRGGLRFVGSRLPDIPELLPANLAIAWSDVGAIMRQKNLASYICPLVGVTSYPAGVLAGPDGQGQRLWSPERFVRARSTPVEPDDLRRMLDGVIAAWAQGRQGLICEMSGGLDSSIIAASLARSVNRPLYGVNHAFPQVEADERVHAEAVARHLDLPLVVVERDLVQLTPEKLAAGAGGPKPNYVGGDPDHDIDIANRLSMPEVDAVFTGRGGDAVLFQPAHPALVRDVLAGRAEGSRLAALEVLARRNVASVWSVLKRGFGARNLTAGASVRTFMPPEAGRLPAQLHPWLESASKLDPARQLQILGVVNGLSAFGESQRHRAGDVIDPWMAQPMFELCLSVPVARLAVGWRDRPFARQAFAERLPEAALARRGKGNLATYFARSLAANADMLEDYLGNGQLAEAGLLDRERLKGALDPAQLIWTSVTAEIFILLALEAWARRWDERLADLAVDPRYGGGLT
jgi:asparagine synthase (glutamine-hydrolysing)